MRGEQRQGRFDVPNERKSIISGITKEIVRTVGNDIEWWTYDEPNTVVDSIYDVGSSNPNTGGRRWHGPLLIPCINAVIYQGVTMQSDRGFYNVDVLRVTFNMDIVERSTDLYGSSSVTSAHFKTLVDNPDEFLRDRLVFRNEVFTPTKMSPRGLMNNKYTVFSLDCNQVNAEELVNDPQFSRYASYDPFNEVPPNAQ